jgi:C4-dicarboxylate transporter
MFKGVDTNDIYIINKKYKYGGKESILTNISHNKRYFLESIESNDNIIYWEYKTYNIEYENSFSKKIQKYTPDFYILVNNTLKIKILFGTTKNIFYAVATAGKTDTVVLSAFPFLNSTIPSDNANKVKSVPTPTFLPGWY